jgi:hypothetical protein
MSNFREAVLRQLASLPSGYSQAKDAFIREMETREGCSFWFAEFRLVLLAWNGFLKKGRPIRSVWKSYDGTPTYMSNE